MENKPILHIQLFRNIMTEKEVNYIARPHMERTITNRDIAHSVHDLYKSFSLEAIESILDMADLEKIKAITDGNNLADGIGQYQVTIRGTFDSPTAVFNPEQHTLSVSFTPSKELLARLNSVQVVSNTKGHKD